MSARRLARKILRSVLISSAVVGLLWIGWMGILFFVVGSIAQSHIDANVPKEEHFDQALRSALERRFCGLSKECRIEYELLRKGPTQSGISYPKYYLWMRCFSENGLKMQGAVRLAAEDERFVVRDFLSSNEIFKSSGQAAMIFPESLVEDIKQRARAANALNKSPARP